ncbi:sigma-54 dependent transcriptional regulator [Roseimicrobium sp. ORNL1]|uniref:sigma-54-dependent transcriptional regulator n=1 Tax=Roseimicrobium sp. ORNL1 TaxID=2711231 RepID=UPI0013E1A420|nr:sigma-54 dependent transcriptional regulator [Roseimicrobium sp. ORNL1]QIF04579.1 sigma-54-dependent Fis family transcriptional regulator [Roseimicrobium sp. ORNL1]
MKRPSRVLIVDASAEDAARTADALREGGYEVSIATNGTEGIDAALGEDVDAVVTEYRLPGAGGLQVISTVHIKKPRLPLILLTGARDGDVAIHAVKSGAYDILPKPVDGAELRSVLEEAIAAARQMSKPVEIGRVYEEQDTLIGKSRAMGRVYRELAKIAATPVTVLIRGETGTGKELIARALYQHGHRAHKPFIAVNCAAIPESLLESELFGHEKGAFTGAVSARIGRFEQAHNATLFLDEIGDMDLHLQAKLLRVLQEKRIQRVGGREDIPVDVRFIAATHRNLEDMINKGEFREDLYYRLNVATIQLPPLRERPEDLPLLVDYFLAKYAEDFGIEKASIAPEAVQCLQQQPWPGNVRQVQNILRKALLKRRSYTITEDDVRELIAESALVRPRQEQNTLAEAAGQMLRRAMDGEIPGAYAEMQRLMERELIGAAMDLSEGNKAKAARWLGISRLTLREKLHQHGLNGK